MRVLLTGGAGFIGSNLALALNARGIDDLVIVDNLKPPGKHMNLGRVRFADFIDKGDLPARLQGLGRFDAILHQGACSSTTETDGAYMMRNNYEFSRLLLEFALAARTPFLYASSASVYGEGEAGFVETPACERPLNVYAFSKWAFDNHVRRVLPRAESQVVGLRYFNVYGPQENHKGSMASVAFHMFESWKTSGVLKVFEGSEGFLRDFVHVDDVVRVNETFLSSGRSGLYNCGTGQARSFVELARAVASRLPGARIETIPFPAHLVGRYQKYTRADLARLRGAGCDAPWLSLEDGVSRYIDVLRSGGGLRSAPSAGRAPEEPAA